MDPSSTGAVMLIVTVGLPAAVGGAEALWRRRGVLGWIGSVVIATVGGIALMLLAVILGGVPFSEGTRDISNFKAGGLFFGGLIGGALVALWLLNRVRASRSSGA